MKSTQLLAVSALGMLLATGCTKAETPEAAADKPVAVDGLVGVRPTLWVNVAVDHRAADGEAGGRLLAALERQIALLPGGSA